MKKIIILFTAVFLWNACTNKKPKNELTISERNYSISKANAYNSLFIDSIVF